MFRLAEVKEIKCLLRSYGTDNLEDEPTPETDESRKAYKKYLTEQVRTSLLQAGFKYIPHQLSKDPTLIPEVERVTGMKFKCTCMKCPDCESICLNFAEGVIAVLERDFIQLTHGERSYLFERAGIQFLLTGITLGLLYVSVPQKSGLDELILSVLVLMMKAEKWVNALQLYGPAAEPELSTKPIRSMTSSKEEMPRVGRRSLCMGTISPRLSRRHAPVDVARCVECKKPFPNDAPLQECDCSAVTIRYTQFVSRDSFTASASSRPDAAAPGGTQGSGFAAAVTSPKPRRRLRSRALTL